MSIVTLESALRIALRHRNIPAMRRCAHATIRRIRSMVSL